MAVGMKTKARWAEYYSAIGRNMTLIDNALSPAKAATIWDYCPSLAMHDPAVAFEFFEDFINVPVDDTTHNLSAWQFVGDTASDSATFPASLVGGWVNVATGGVDNNETYFQLGHATTAAFEPFKITDSSNKPVYFSCKINPLQVTEHGIFVGLAEANAISGGNFMADDTGVIADKDHIGFAVKVDAPTELDFVWKKNGQAAQEIANVATIDGGTTPIKCEFWFDGSSTIRVYLDGVLNGTTAATSGATFPSGEEMSPIIAIKTGAGAAKHVQIDWIKIVQIR